VKSDQYVPEESIMLVYAAIFTISAVCFLGTIIS
jgi:hypothetical protein